MKSYLLTKLRLEIAGAFLQAAIATRDCESNLPNQTESCLQVKIKRTIVDQSVLTLSLGLELKGISRCFKIKSSLLTKYLFLRDEESEEPIAKLDTCSVFNRLRRRLRVEIAIPIAIIAIEIWHDNQK